MWKACTRFAVSVTGRWKSIPPLTGIAHAEPPAKRLAAPSVKYVQALLRMFEDILQPDA